MIWSSLKNIWNYKVKVLPAGPNMAQIAALLNNSYISYS
jgi:hypothetical protein